MTNIFTLNHEADTRDTIDTINDRLHKARAIITSILCCSTSDNDCPHDVILGVLAALDGYLEEVESLAKVLGKSTLAHNS